MSLIEKQPRQQRHIKRKIRIMELHEKWAERESRFLPLCEEQAKIVAEEETLYGFEMAVHNACRRLRVWYDYTRCQTVITNIARSRYDQRRRQAEYEREAKEVSSSPLKASIILLDIALALAPLKLPPYVLMWIVDWLPGFVHFSDFNKITLLQNVHRRHRDLPRLRLIRSFEVDRVLARKREVGEMFFGFQFTRDAICSTRAAVKTRLARLVFLDFKESEFLKRLRRIRRKEIDAMKLSMSSRQSAIEAAENAIRSYRRRWLEIREAKKRAVLMIKQINDSSKICRSWDSYRQLSLGDLLHSEPIYFTQSENFISSTRLMKWDEPTRPQLSTSVMANKIRHDEPIQPTSFTTNKIRKSTKELEKAFGILKK
jgi:hypothetical protein